MRRCVPCAILHSCGEAEATLKRLVYCVAQQSQPERESRLVHLHRLAQHGVGAFRSPRLTLSSGARRAECCRDVWAAGSQTIS
jgi:hypothetical protein